MPLYYLFFSLNCENRTSFDLTYEFHSFFRSCVISLMNIMTGIQTWKCLIFLQPYTIYHPFQASLWHLDLIFQNLNNCKLNHSPTWTPIFSISIAGPSCRCSVSLLIRTGVGDSSGGAGPKEQMSLHLPGSAASMELGMIEASCVADVKRWFT